MVQFEKVHGLKVASVALGMVLAVLAPSFSPARAVADDTPTTNTDGERDIAREVDQILSSYASNTQFNGSVMVSKGGKVQFNKSYGLANREHGIPFTSDSKFLLASLTKQFTAALVLQLRDEGKLSLQNRINSYLSRPPQAWQQITIHQLLNHTSGIPDYMNDAGFEGIRSLELSLAQLIQKFSALPLDFRPGQQFKYSNSGYILLGFMLEKVTGQSFETLVKRRILEPNGLTGMGYSKTATVLPGRVAGYTYEGGQWKNAYYVHENVLHAAGGLYGTVEDLHEWARALMVPGKVLSATSLQQMLTPGLDEYGYGVRIEQKFGHRAIWHSGTISGFAHRLIIYPELDATIVILSNLRVPSAPIPEISEKIMQVVVKP